MNIDTSYSVKPQQYQPLQKSSQTANAAATGNAAIVQEDGTTVEYASAISSIEPEDRVEISAEGQRALEQMLTAQSDTESEDNGVDATQLDALTSSSSSEDAEMDEDVSSTDLYSLTETELQSLLTEGSITRSEYSSELARRGLDSVS